MVHRGAANTAESGVDQTDDRLPGQRVQADQVQCHQGPLLPGQGRQRVRSCRTLDACHEEEERRYDVGQRADRTLELLGGCMGFNPLPVYFV